MNLVTAMKLTLTLPLTLVMLSDPPVTVSIGTHTCTTREPIVTKSGEIGMNPAVTTGPMSAWEPRQTW